MPKGVSNGAKIRNRYNQVQRETFYNFFTSLINSKFISELVSGVKFSCVLMQHKKDKFW